MTLLQLLADHGPDLAARRRRVARRRKLHLQIGNLAADAADSVGVALAILPPHRLRLGLAPARPAKQAGAAGAQEIVQRDADLLVAGAPFVEPAALGHERG